MTRDFDQRGQTTPMIVGFFFILAILTAVVVDSSSAYLQRQSLANLADGAALAGADGGTQGEGNYTNGFGDDRAVLDEAAARAAVEEYFAMTESHKKLPGFAYDMTVADETVIVRVSSVLDLPLSVPGASGSARVGATGSSVAEISR